MPDLAFLTRKKKGHCVSIRSGPFNFIGVVTGLSEPELQPLESLSQPTLRPLLLLRSTQLRQAC